jgi:hypothetical protein
MCHHISNALRRNLVFAHVPSHFKRILQQEQSNNLNYDSLQNTVHARLLGHRFLGRLTGRLEPEML